MTDSLSSINTVNESLSYDRNEISLLGVGDSSTVRRGAFNGQEVAVKKLDKRTLTDDDKELLMSIKHENIVEILSIVTNFEHDYIVLELCLASFHQYFKEYEKVMNKFSGLTVVKKEIIRDAVTGLEYLHLHEKSIVHRDIKPGNILLIQKSSSSEVKAVLADFGISTKLNNRDAVTTHRGRGTETWMAPELLLEDRRACKFSRESDIFAMGCVLYFVETGGNHPFDTGDNDDFVIHQNVKKYDPCDFRLLNGKPKASALIKKMILYDRASRPSASEVLQDPYFKEDGPQDTIQVPPQLIRGVAPQGDTQQDTSEVDGDGHTGIPPQGDTQEDISEVDGDGHTGIPPQEVVPDYTSYGEQLHDVMSNMSHSLPRYIIDHYIRLLTIINVKSDIKPDWSLSKRFLELYSTHTSETSPQVAGTYVYKILTGLGYEEVDENDFRAYLHIELEIDTKITEELGKIAKFRPAVIEVVDELGPKLGDYQMSRYRMVLTVLRVATFDSNESFFKYFGDLTGKLGKCPLAVAFTIGVLERSGWGDTKKLKPFSLPEFDLNTAYPEVDLCLTVADYYSNMIQRDFSSAKAYTSSCYLNNHNVSSMSRVQFTLLLMDRGVVQVGDVSKIEDKVRYPIFFKKYKERCRRPSKDTAPTTETVTQETVTQETVTQTTSNQSPPTPTGQQASAQVEQPPATEKGAISRAAFGLALNGIQQFILNDEVIYEAVPAPIPPPDFFPKEDDKEYETKLFEAVVRAIVKNIYVLLMTATENELRGVLGYLKPLDGRNKVIKSFINATWIYIGKYGEYSVVVGRSAYSRSQQGGLDAVAVTNKIMEIFKPKYIIAVGICFGMDQKKVNLGDVIVSDFIVDLSDFRMESGSIAVRKPQPPAGATLSPLFGNSSGFKMKHSDGENAKEVKVHCGSIVSSPVLVDDEEFKKQLREVRRDALAGEMEGAAIFSAARHAHHKPEAIVIKAVGDWANGKKDECRGWKDFASHAAARYVHHQLNNLSHDALK